jgi:spoIIIJ-associated protein
MSTVPPQPPRFDRDAVVAGLHDFLKLVLAQARLDLRYEVRALDPERGEVEHPEVLVAFSGRDQELLLERNAELLQALEYLAVRWLRLDPKSYDHVRFDSGDYRALRLEELKLSARVAAERVVASRQPFRFNPMSSRERRVIHLALKDIPGVRTSSEGTGERRQVVVYPAETK